MNDQTIPADEVRKIIAFYRDGASDRGGMILDALRALLPAPPLPTLADMTKAEREACERMQCDVKDEVIRAVIINPHWESGSARVLWPGAFIEQIDWERVTPRPDLPRMEWPGEQHPTPAPALPEGWRLADHKGYGRVIVTNTTPSHDGYVTFVYRANFLTSGRGNDWCKPDELMFLDGTESPTPARVGDTIESADPRIDSLPAGSILCDLDGDDMEKTATGEWRDADGITIESPGCGPWTVHRIGNGADQ